jgi:hypothetical protein
VQISGTGSQNIKLIRGRKEGRKVKSEVVDEIEMAETRYDAWRAPNKICFYRDKPCRLTGEIHCLHLEWHLNGLRAVRRAGIESGQDLVDFDHRSFWDPRLLLFDVDIERLGRLVRNQSTGKKSRASGSNYFTDRRTGHTLMKSVDGIQELIDLYGSQLRVHRVLRRISNEALLPHPVE